MPQNPNILSGLIRGPGLGGEIVGGFNPNGTKTTKPITFLGGTVLGFNATLGIGPLEESSLNVEIINDCFANSFITNPQGDHFLGEPNIGAPVFFDLGEATALEINRQAHEAAVLAGKEVFKFGGILQSFTAQQSSGGLTFNARVVDPRSLLAGVNIVVSNNLSGPIKHRNYYNVYAYYEYAVLKPSKREPQKAYTLPDTVEQDLPVVVLGDPDSVDCSVFGSANSDERGMAYYKVVEALKKMNPLVYSGNYGELFAPPLEGRDLTVAQASNNTRHQQNVFRIDLSELPIAPAYYRVPGPNITLLDLINNVCEATGHIFHVTLEESPIPNKLHTIKIKVVNINNLRNLANNNGLIKSEILAYNGRSTDLSYGKELSTENSRTMMIGEQKHQMYETVNIEPFFGEDKDGKPIVPNTGTIDACGWEIEIYLDDLNNQLRCPLFDYNLFDSDGDVILDRENNVVQRKVKLSEFHIRVAMSSFELWKKFVLNPFNNEDLASVIRRNFPNSVDFSISSLNKSIRNTQEYREAERQRRIDEGEEDPVTDPPEHTDEASAKSQNDLLNFWNNSMMQSLERKRTEALESVYNYLSSFARTYYGKQYLAIISKDLCVADANYMDLNILNPEGIRIDKNYAVFDEPCDTLDANQDNVIILNNKLWRPRIYSHVPTNDGAWVEPCGSVLGLGSYDDQLNLTTSYLDFFRSEDGRVTPMARFDSKVLTSLYRTESLIDEGMSFDPDNPNVKRVSSIVEGLFKDGEFTLEGDLEQILYISGVCGDLELKEWSADNYIQLRDSGNAICSPPTEEIDPVEAIDLPTTVWAKCSVGDTFYLDPSGELSYKEIYYEPVSYLPGFVDTDCCGKYQIWNPLSPCFWADLSTPPPDEDCVAHIRKEVEVVQTGLVKIPIIFDEPCFTKYCDSQNQFEMLAAETEFALLGISGVLEEGQSPVSYSYDTDGVRKDGVLIRPTKRFCWEPKPEGIALIASALDFNSTNNQKLHPSAFIPTAVAIPVKSNIETYGPWKSQNFETSAGGIELIQDPDFNPWVFNSVAKMNTFAKDIVNDRSFNKSEIETGSVTFPYFPDKPLGFVENGPNLTNINVNMGSNGVTTTYTYRTYTPKFGGLKTLEKNAIKSNLELVNKIKRLSREKERKIDVVNRKLKGSAKKLEKDLNPKLTEAGTLQRIIIGETYPFSVLTEPNYVTITDPETEEETVVQSGYNTTGSGDRTVVGTETLQKSVVELRYDYRKKAFMSWDGLLSPVTNSFNSHLPMYAYYSETPISAKSIYNSPNPPVQYSGNSIHNISIDQSHLDPLTNPFGIDGHHHIGSGAGHNIDVVGRGDDAPESGVIMNFYGQSKWESRYSDEYRFLGLRGPLVLHAWGYDTQGKPIPNAIDDPDLIQKSGIFRTEVSGEGDAAVTGLQDYFMQDWLHKPSAWPVAPVDLRYDRQRGVWVSPPDYKIVVVEAGDSVSAYGSGTGYLINEREDKKYNQEIYDASGVPVKADDGNEVAKITIEDRIGRNISSGEKSYAYFDAFTSTYLLMGGGGGGGAIKIGKFCNQWPSLSNVKDPANAVKKVVLYEPAKSGCDGYGNNLDTCPWALEPVMTKVSGIDVPVVVEAINLFSNVAAHEYQTKWCALSQDGDTYYLLAAEC